MAQLPIDFLLRGDGTKFLPIASLDSVMDGNKTLREILEEYSFEKMNKIYKTSSIVLYRDSLAAGIKGPITGYLKIGLPNNSNVDESINLNISVINKKEESFINIGTEILSTSFIGSSSFCSNTTPIDGSIRLANYQGKKNVILGKTNTIWENALIIINFSASNKIDDNWFSNYTLEILNDESILTNLTIVPINNAFKIDNVDKVNGFRVDDSKGGTNEEDDNALWTAFKIKNEISKNSGIIVGSPVLELNENGTWKFKVDIPVVFEYKENSIYAFNFSEKNGGNSTININSLGEKTIYKIKNNKETLLENNDLLPNIIYLLIYKKNKFILIFEDTSSYISSANKEITTVLTDDNFVQGFYGTLKTKDESAFYPKTKTSFIFDGKSNENLDSIILNTNQELDNIKQALNNILELPTYSGEKGNVVALDGKGSLINSEEKLSNYVKKEEGKNLSSNDYTNEDKILVSTIQDKADKSELPNDVISLTLTVEGWQQSSEGIYKQSITNENITDNMKLNLSFATDSMIKTLMDAGIGGLIAENNAGTASVILYGEKPAIEIPVQIELVDIKEVV